MRQLPTPRSRRNQRLIAAFSVMFLAVTCLAACSNQPSVAVNQSEATHLIASPLATSIETSNGTWATIPMGVLTQPANTFWQLLYEPTGTDRWSDDVEPTATATNGGIVLASTPSGALLAGVRPTNLLKFSPIILTVDNGHSWTDGVTDEGLVAEPDALAVENPSMALGLVNAATGVEVLQSNRGLGDWQSVTDQNQLASNPASDSCGLRDITAVAYLDGNPVVAGDCNSEGVAGIYMLSSGEWRSDGPSLPSGLDGDRIQVLALRAVGTGLSALMYGTGKDGRYLVAEWTENGKGWSQTSALRVGASESLMSISTGIASQLLLLLGSGSGSSQTLLEANGPNSLWHELPSPPSGTATASFGSGSSVTALSVDESVLRVWSLKSESSRWTLAQVIHVPIQYGSSS
jgi:hypothetical protein